MKDRKITCKCGSNIGPRYVGKIVHSTGTYFNWECDFCGQSIVEKEPDALVINEPDIKKAVSFYKSE